MKRLSIVMALVLVATLVSACAGINSSMRTNRANLLRLEPGMNEAQIVEIMGQPNFKDVNAEPARTRTVLWYYTNEMGDGCLATSMSHIGVTRQDCTPLVLVGNKLTATGKAAKLYY
ncbi:hypothetical protein GGQ74_000230 [Desulfobaculum xiamenense]|uniref:SmpA / OmlA family protein n=1 Tax=Desulfobaculum xiamenense TaxID=995050 RepID=A0A846QHJ8_9BACT|nr:DUF3192 domain-containing protein [Desulfobaculum xiamenense]NJB66590.1 hypothetical protein [Desulfobaculum xiamenense]